MGRTTRNGVRAGSTRDADLGPPWVVRARCRHWLGVPLGASRLAEGARERRVLTPDSGHDDAPTVEPQRPSVPIVIATPREPRGAQPLLHPVQRHWRTTTRGNRVRSCHSDGWRHIYQRCVGVTPPRAYAICRKGGRLMRTQELRVAQGLVALIYDKVEHVPSGLPQVLESGSKSRPVAAFQGTVRLAQPEIGVRALSIPASSAVILARCTLLSP